MFINYTWDVLLPMRSKIEIEKLFQILTGKINPFGPQTIEDRKEYTETCAEV